LSKLHNDLANCIRFLSIDAVQKANSGHPGMPMGMADVATVLFKNFLKFNPKNPGWLNRDRFVLSAGHGSMLLYSLLHLTGYKSISLNSIKSLGSSTRYVQDIQNTILRLVSKLQQAHLVKELQMQLVLQSLRKF